MLMRKECFLIIQVVLQWQKHLRSPSKNEEDSRAQSALLPSVVSCTSKGIH